MDLKKFDVKIIRTDISDNPEDYMRETGGMKSPPMVPRDYTAMIGSKFFLPGSNFGKNIDIETELKSLMEISSLSIRNVSDFHKDLLKYVYDLTFPGRPVSSVSQSMILKSMKDMRDGKVKKLLQAIDTDDLRNIIFQGHTNTIGKISKYAHDEKTYPYRTLEKFVKETHYEIQSDLG